MPLVLSWKASDFIVSGCNRYVYEWLEKWPSERINNNFVCLVGESGAGKTHLANIWADRVKADVVTSSSDIFSKWYELSSSETAQRYFVLDDADQIGDDVLLYYIYNTVKEKNAYVLMTAKNPPSRWRTKLPDIRSRISTINVINIHGPNEDEMKQIFEKMLERRGIKAHDEMINYICNRIDRSYESMNYWAHQLDQITSSKRREVLQKLKTKLRTL
jgi:chromosomal replication initiation ATPase DnaA